jgi:uncharacterized protein YuzE
MTELRFVASQDEGQSMKVHFDESSDAVYFRLDDSKIIESEEVKPGIILDFNAKKQVVGVEILNVRKRVPAANLKEMKFEVA